MNGSEKTFTKTICVNTQEIFIYFVFLDLIIFRVFFPVLIVFRLKCICTQFRITLKKVFHFLFSCLFVYCPRCRIDHSFFQGWNPPFSEGTHPPPFWVPPLSDANLKTYRSLSESNLHWCLQIVRKTLKWRCSVWCYTKSIENIINITLFTFRLNSVFTTDTFFG